MSLPSRLLARILNLPPAETYDITVDRDLEVRMPDGAVLLADRYAPRGVGPRPTILSRSPYGRRGFWGLLYGRPLAERGFQVVIQSCRGTFGSGGAFDAFRHEREDGLATVAWLKEQPWFSGKFGTIGPSYLGLTQWAIAAEAGPDLGAIAAFITASSFRASIFAGESFWLDTALTWISILDRQERSVPAQIIAFAREKAKQRAAAASLPLRRADEIAAGAAVPFYRDWLDHPDADDPWWRPVDFSEGLDRVTAPVYLLGGWYDIFLPETISDYTRLAAAGRSPHLTIGPWAHTDMRWLGPSMHEAIAWFKAHLSGDRRAIREAPVRVFVMGADTWRDLPSWPPPDAQIERWYLQPGNGLAKAPPAASPPDHYRYDPRDPTPSVGGATLSDNAGPKDNRALESRSDVLVYTSAPLDRDLEVIGPVTAEIHFASSLDHTDVHVRLCDVDEAGKSINITDGLLRLSPGRPAAIDGERRAVTVTLWPTACRFRRGHRLRVQVSSGAHPRYARNPGSGEPLAAATTLVAADQTVYHDPDRPSAIALSVMP